MTDDIYAGIADRYDLLGGRSGEHEVSKRAFFQRLFREQSIRRVLDCACCTGRDLVLLNSLGPEVVGSDISPTMLGQARANLAAQELDIELAQADYRELPQRYAEPFDAVICLSSSLLHMPDEAEAQRALRSMREVLRERGILVLTQGTTDRQWAARPRFIPVVNTPEFSRLFVIDYHEPGATYHILDLFHTHERAEFKSWSCTYAHIWLRDDYDRLLAGAGFSEVRCYGSWSFEPYDKQASNRLIVVGKR